MKTVEDAVREAVIRTERGGSFEIGNDILDRLLFDAARYPFPAAHIEALLGSEWSVASDVDLGRLRLTYRSEHDGAAR